MVFLILLCLAGLAAVVISPSQARAQSPVEPGDSRKPDFFPSRQQRMFEAANAISVMLFSNTFEMTELGEKALEIIGEAIEADFIELWKNQDHPSNTVCKQVCWWEKSGLQTHSQKARTISYDGLFHGWLEELKRDNLVYVTNGSAGPDLHEELNNHKTNRLIAVPVFFANSLWGFLRLGVSSGFSCFTETEQKILRSIGLFLVASIRRHQTQAALRASEDRFRDVTIATGEIVWELDANGFFSYISPLIRKATGYTAEELVGKRWEDISTGEYKDSITSELFQAGVTEGIFADFEHAIITRSGTLIWLRSAAKLLTDAFGIAGLRGTSFDYTKAHETALKLEHTLEALQNSNFELEQAVQYAYTLADKANSANTAKQNFLNNISHEIRTPLNSISGTLYLLEQTRLTELQRQYLIQIQNASTSLMGIMDNILHFTNLQLGTEENPATEVHLTKLFEMVSEQFGTKLARKNLYSVFGIASNVPINLVGDVDGLHQIITNLMDNAVKFTERGAVALYCTLASEKSANDIMLQFTVKDTGMGIPADMQQSMLEAFTQEDASSTRRFGGTGLGLTIAHQLVTINAGRLMLDSTPGKGTSISFTFAMKPPANAQLEYTPKSFFQRVGIIVEGAPGEHFFVNAVQNIGYAVQTIHVDTFTGATAQSANSIEDVDILCAPLNSLQTYAAELEQFFDKYSEAFPTVVALMPQTTKQPQLPDFVTHTINGPILTFLYPKAVKWADKDKGIAFFHRERLTPKQLAAMREQLTTIISFLDDSDIEGLARFNEIRQGLAELDEKTTTEINNYLHVFQFSEAIPLLISLKEKIDGYEQ